MTRWASNGWIQESNFHGRSYFMASKVSKWICTPFMNWNLLFYYPRVSCIDIHTIFTSFLLFFFLKKGWIILLLKKCNCRDWQFFKALKILHLFAALSLHMLMHLGFADFGTVLQQNNEPEINSLAIMHILFPYSISNQMSCLLNLFTKSVDFNQHISDVRRKQTQGFLKSN